MTSFQKKITEVVHQYIRTNPQEYKAVKILINEQRKELRTKFAEPKGKGVLGRKLVEIPETLFSILVMRLSLEETEYYKSKSGTRWFAKQFPEFKVAEKI